jgi:glycosyltransferase involved in cell wall biosynthesis
MGHDVSFIASQWVYNKNGEIVHTDKSCYLNKDGVKMIRLQNRRGESYAQKFRHFLGLYDALKKENPDIIFIHGPQFLEMPEVVKYVKKNNVTVYVDNHADFSNSGRTFLSKYILQKMLWRYMAQKINPFTRKFYGVLPARVDWLINMYKLPADKCELLVMGADDEAVERVSDGTVRKDFRKQHGIAEDDFLIMTGGKIDAFKQQTLLLMEAIGNIKDNRVKLCVFGSVEKDIMPKLKKLCDGEKIQYIGWAQGEQSYEFFSAADLAVFPGRHSVFWEQVAGMGIPMVCKYWDGTTHVDVGGNVKFLMNDSVAEIQELLEEIINNPNEYKTMLEVAQGKGKEQFSYRDIARRSLMG